MRSKSRWLLAGILVFILASAGLAFQNEPEGFRGLKWGDPLIEDMTYVYTDGKRDFYTRSQEKMKIGEMPLNNVVYIFYKKRFASSGVFFSGEE